MDTFRIRAFLLVAEKKSFSAAAEALSYTPSAFSHIADSLEAELGVTLFERTHQGTCLTKNGQKLYDKMKAVCQAEEDLKVYAFSLSEQESDIVRIGAYSSIAVRILPEILQEFKKAHPNVRPEIVVEDNILRGLRESTLDLVFVDSRPDSEEFHWYPLIEDSYVAVVPAIDWKHKRKVCREELYAFPFIRMQDEMLEGYFEDEKFAEIIPLHSIENHSAISMVKEGLGVAVLPALTIETAPPGVRVLQLVPPRTRTIGLVYKKGRRNKATDAFIRYLKQTMRM